MKFDLNYFISVDKSISYVLKNDPSLSLFQNELLVKNINKKNQLKPEEFIKYIYFNSKTILDNLFDTEEKINIEDMITINETNKNLEQFLFYLCILIQENRDMVFFTYSKNFIKHIYECYIFENEKHSLHNFIMSIIMNVL